MRLCLNPLTDSELSAKSLSVVQQHTEGVGAGSTKNYDDRRRKHRHDVWLRSDRQRHAGKETLVRLVEYTDHPGEFSLACIARYQECQERGLTEIGDGNVHCWADAVIAENYQLSRELLPNQIANDAGVERRGDGQRAWPVSWTLGGSG